MKSAIKKFFSHILAAGVTPGQRAAAISLGVFIAFSPFLGIQTLLIFALSWLLGLNPAITFATVYLVNNPWTMIPIAAADYIVGLWLIEIKLGYNLVPYNPFFMDWINRKIGYYIMKYLGIKQLCFWYYILGGLILAFILSVLLYPIIKLFFVLYEHRHENNHPEQKSLS